MLAGKAATDCLSPSRRESVLARGLSVGDIQVGSLLPVSIELRRASRFGLQEVWRTQASGACLNKARREMFDGGTGA
jgi:hypothetical protein